MKQIPPYFSSSREYYIIYKLERKNRSTLMEARTAREALAMFKEVFKYDKVVVVEEWITERNIVKHSVKNNEIETTLAYLFKEE